MVLRARLGPVDQQDERQKTAFSLDYINGNRALEYTVGLQNFNTPNNFTPSGGNGRVGSIFGILCPTRFNTGVVHITRRVSYRYCWFLVSHSLLAAKQSRGSSRANPGKFKESLSSKSLYQNLWRPTVVVPARRFVVANTPRASSLPEYLYSGTRRRPHARCKRRQVLAVLRHEVLEVQVVTIR